MVRELKGQQKEKGMTEKKMITEKDCWKLWQKCNNLAHISV